MKKNSYHRLKEFFKQNRLLCATVCNPHEKLNEMEHFLEKWFAKTNSRRNGKSE